MGLTVSTDEKGVMVFANEKDGQNGKYTLYSIGVSSKNQNNEWVSGFISVRFKKGVEVANKSKIKINNGFYTVSKSNGKTYTSIMITDFDVLEEGEPKADEDGWVKMDDSAGSDLPFAD